MVAVTLALFAGGIVMGIAGALMWAWGVHSGQFRDLEATKQQLFWPELAPDDGSPAPRSAAEETTR
jgi:cbb3-type cytochrome oxidase maturation protein